jgi:hypothetical protein
MPSLDGTDSSNISTALEVTGKLQTMLKIFEDDREKSFMNWAFTENDKCSVNEVI